ncbi:MAG TPA: hypothetical protein VKB53_14095, partial [Gammaproteobacteria bacterium]|nr:hypothetical protein [Gammaproteobacteria bacterium]
ICVNSQCNLRDGPCCACGTPIHVPFGPVLTYEADGKSSLICCESAAKYSPEAVDELHNRWELRRMVRACQRGEQTPLVKEKRHCAKCGGLQCTDYILDSKVISTARTVTASDGLSICRCKTPLEGASEDVAAEATPGTNVIAFDRNRTRQ